MKFQYLTIGSLSRHDSRLVVSVGFKYLMVKPNVIVVALLNFMCGMNVLIDLTNHVFYRLVSRGFFSDGKET